MKFIRHGFCTGALTFFAAMLLLSSARPSVAADVVLVDIYPKDVGVFANKIPTQQFVAFGKLSDGTWKNITEEVVWESSDESIVTIDENGLATVTVAGLAIVKTVGFDRSIITISATYPKTPPGNPGANLLLLQSQEESAGPGDPPPGEE
jgi:hypothetical protein